MQHHWCTFRGDRAASSTVLGLSGTPSDRFHTSTRLVKPRVVWGLVWAGGLVPGKSQCLHVHHGV